MPSFTKDTTSEEVVDAFAGRITGRTFVVTGPSDKSLGAQTAISLARRSPKSIILLSRNKTKVDPVISEIQSIDPAITTAFVQCDLADEDSVRAAAAEVLRATDKIDVLINCAGIMNVQEYTVDKKGNEITFSANHLGHFLLTGLLMPRIVAAGPGSRVVNVSSGGYRISPVRFDDPAFSGGAEYDGWSAYGQSKTANILFSIELARRFSSNGVSSSSVHPGVIFGTGLALHFDLAQLGKVADIAFKNTGERSQNPESPKSLSQGAASILEAALDPELESGSYVTNCQKTEIREYARDAGNARKLWDLSERLIGKKFGE